MAITPAAAFASLLSPDPWEVLSNHLALAVACNADTRKLNKILRRLLGGHSHKFDEAVAGVSRAHAERQSIAEAVINNPDLHVHLLDLMRKAAAESAQQPCSEPPASIDLSAEHTEYEVVDLECSAGQILMDTPVEEHAQQQQDDALASSQGAAPWAFLTNPHAHARLLDLILEEEVPSKEQQAVLSTDQMDTADCSPDGVAHAQQQHTNDCSADEADPHERNGQLLSKRPHDEIVDLTDDDEDQELIRHFIIDQVRDAFEALLASAEQFKKNHTRLGAILRPDVYARWLELRGHCSTLHDQVAGEQYEGSMRSSMPVFFDNMDETIFAMRKRLNVLFAELNAAAPAQHPCKRAKHCAA